MPTLQRTVYIGLGGAGIRSILHAKKRFIESYGEVPPMIRFIGIDTNVAQLESRGEDVVLDPLERCLIRGWDLSAWLKHWRQQLTWARESDVAKCMTGLRYSADQVRTHGRLAFFYDFPMIKHILLQAVREIEGCSGSTDYVLGGGPVVINIAFSLVGGTGSGIFLDLGYLVRKLFGTDVRINGYAILPRVYLPYGGLSLANGYAAIQELDFLMNLRPEDEPVTINWLSESFDEEDFRRCPTPYDMVFLIDHVKPWVGVVYELKDLLKEVGLALFAAGGQMGIQNGALLDTLRYPLREGTFNIANKRPWASSLGVSEIVFDGKKAADYFALKVTGRMVLQSLSATGYYSVTPVSWVDNMEIKPRELVERLCSTNRHSCVIHYIKDPRPEVDEYQNRVISDARSTIDGFVDNYLPSIILELKTVVSKCLEWGNSVSRALRLISGLEDTIPSFVRQAESERCDFEKRRLPLDSDLKRSSDELVGEARRFFVPRSRKDELREKCEVYAKEFAINEIEILRRQGAIRFYESLMRELESQRAVLERQEAFMHQLSLRLDERGTAIEWGTRQCSSCIDLSIEPINMGLVNNELTPSFGDFYRSIGIEVWEGIDTVDALEQAFFGFVEGLPDYGELRNMTVIDWISAMSEQDRAKLINVAIRRASPCIHRDGESPGLPSTPIWHIIGLDTHSVNDSSFTGRGIVELVNDRVGEVHLVDTGIKNRIIVFTHDKMFPPFKIVDFEAESAHYEMSRVDHYFDANIHERMIKERYSLYPQKDFLPAEGYKHDVEEFGERQDFD